MTPKQWIMISDAVLSLIATIVTLKIAEGPNQAILLATIATIATILPVILGYTSENKVVSLNRDNKNLRTSLDISKASLAVRE